MKAISNASPLIFLTKINRLAFLDGYGIMVPEQVFDELKAWEKTDSMSYLILSRWMENHGITPKKVEVMGNLPKGLGKGERSAISLAAKGRIKVVLVDEKKARIAAKSLGLVPKGTIAVIYQQYLEKKITGRECRNLVLELVRKGYRIREEILAEFLQGME